MNRDRSYLLHIKDAIALIRQFTQSVRKEDFFTNREKQGAVILQLTLIGEMSKRLSEEVRSEIPLPWNEIMAFRNRAVHDYYTLDIDIVWTTIQEDLGLIETQVSKHLLEKTL